MVTNFDWARFNDSQWYGYPKNPMWDGLPQWSGEIVVGNTADWTPEYGDLRNAHKFSGFNKGIWYCSHGALAEGTDWMTHIADVVAAFLA